MWFHHSKCSRPSRRPVKSLTLPTRWKAFPLRLEALDERVVPAFLGAVNYAAGTEPRTVVTGDFNNDAVLDLAVPNTHSQSVSVLLGNADGTFQPALSSSVGYYPNSLAVGDFDADGKLDLGVIGNAGIPVAAVLLGNGNGTFQSQAQSLIGNFGTSPFSTFANAVAVGDFNADGKLDLCATINVNGAYYGNEPEAGVAVLLGSGTGTLSGPVLSSIGIAGVSAAVVADFNADNKLDFAAVSDYGNYLSVQMGNGDGTFGGGYSNFGLGSPSSVVAADLNSDGKVDLATTSSDSMRVFLGDGLGSFSSPQSYATGSYPVFMAAADFNRDRAMDLITVNTAGTLNVLLGTGTGAFQPPVSTAVVSTPSMSVVGLTVGDFNRDGWMDATYANYASNNVSVHLNDGVWPAPGSPSISINDVILTEGNAGTRTAAFTVTLSSASSKPVTVSYSTANGSATAGFDYQSATGILTFAPGEVNKTATVLVNGDRLGEPNETFIINLSSPTNATIADGTGVGTIGDDEPRISISDVSKKESRKGLTTKLIFTVTLSVAYDQPVTMSFRTVNGTAKTGDDDYVAKSGTITFNPGETTKTITIVVNGDNKRESDEVFYLDLSGNSSNSLFTKSRGIGTILNDD